MRAREVAECYQRLDSALWARCGCASCLPPGRLRFMARMRVVINDGERTRAGITEGTPEELAELTKRIQADRDQDLAGKPIGVRWEDEENARGAPLTGMVIETGEIEE